MSARAVDSARTSATIATSQAQALALASPPAAPAITYWLLWAFLVLEYARPPAIASLRLQMVISLVLPIFWLITPNRPWSPILTAQTLFVAHCAVAVLYASNYFSAYMTTRVMFTTVALGATMAWMLTSRAALQRTVSVWIAIIAYLGFFGVTHGGRGPGGFVGDENDLSLAMVTGIPFAWYGFERQRGLMKVIFGASGVIMVLGVIASFSRGGFVGLVGAVLFCAFSSGRKLLSLGMLTVGLGAFLLFASPTYKTEMMTILDTEEGTAGDRKFLWQAAWNMFKDNPVLGVGGANFNFRAGEYQPTEPPYDKPEYLERNWSGTTVHSFYYQVLSEDGLVGAVLIGWMVAVHFRALSRLRREVRARHDAPDDLRRDVEQHVGALLGAAVGYLVAGAFISVAYYPYLWYFTAMGVALETGVRRELARIGSSTMPSR